MSKDSLYPQVGRFLKNREQSQRSDVIAPTVDMEKIPQELKEIAERLATLTGTWNPVEFVNATSESVTQEKKKVLAAFGKGKEYNPIFEYENVNKLEMDVEAVEKELLEMIEKVRAFIPTNTLERIARVVMYFKLKDDIASVGLILGIRNGDDKRTKESMNTKYAAVDETLLLKAEEAYDEAIAETANPTQFTGETILYKEQQELLKTQKVNDEEIKAAFEWILAKYGILRTESNPVGFEVVIDKETSYIDVRDKSQRPMTIFVPQGREITGEKLLEMCGHEIESHARQSINGIKTVGVGGGLLKVDEEGLYEGEARNQDHTLHKRYFGEIDNSPVMLYVVAIAQAEQGASFAQVFKDQVDRHMHVKLGVARDISIDYSSEKAREVIDDVLAESWKKTYRVFRGHTDTSNKEQFAFRKDAAYFQGLMLKQQLSDQGYGYINEAAIMQTDALPLMGRVKFQEKDIPHPYQNLTQEYCFQVLIPLLTEKSKESSAKKE